MNISSVQHEAEEHPMRKFLFCPICGSAHFIVHNEASKKCEACGFTYYANPRGATVALIRNEKGELLVARRAKEPAKGTLDLPGGFIENDETAEEGVAREVLEETGLETDAARYLFSVPNIYPYSGITIHTIDLFFECLVCDFSTLRAMDDVSSLQWIPIDKLCPEQFGLASIKKGVARFLKMIDFSASESD